MLIIKNGKGKKRTFLGVLLLGTIFMGLCTTTIATNVTYEVALNKGTETFMVNEYNEKKWDDTIEDDLEPDDWFDGDSDEVGAKSKITIRSVDDYKWDMYEILTSILDVWNFIPEGDLRANESIILMAYLSEDYIDELYPDKYKVWEALSVKWEFEIEEFDEEPDDSKYIIPIFKNPEDFKEILDNYNEWATAINLKMVSFGLKPYPVLDGDDFLWQLIINGMLTIARPFNEYLTVIVDELDCKNADVKEDTIIIEKKGEDDYSVEVKFNVQGFQSSLVIKNDNGKVIYEIIQDTTDIIILILMGVVATTFAGIISILIKRKKQHKY